MSVNETNGRMRNALKHWTNGLRAALAESWVKMTMTMTTTEEMIQEWISTSEYSYSSSTKHSSENDCFLVVSTHGSTRVRGWVQEELHCKRREKCVSIIDKNKCLAVGGLLLARRKRGLRFFGERRQTDLHCRKK